MARVSVHGRDPAREAYRIETEHGGAWVPECLMEGLRPGERPSHQEAYEWIAANRAALARAVRALRRGARPRSPFDLLTLVDES
jgi:hypothetical protein